MGVRLSALGNSISQDLKIKTSTISLYLGTEGKCNQWLHDSRRSVKTGLGSGEELAYMVMDLITNPYMNGETVRVDAGVRLPPR